MLRIHRVPPGALVLLLIAGTALAAAGRGVITPLPPACEPSAELTVGARVTSQLVDGGHGKLWVEIMVDSLVDLGASDMSFASKAGRSVQSEDLPSQLGPQGKETRRTIQGTIDLPDDAADEITFEVRGRDAAGKLFVARGIVKADFDPAHKPVLKGNVLEYQAQPQGR